ncbi:MAG: C-terminal binding protein [Actinomycetota bacterium]|nr:C-terminal binding protein [Actinomycetota bacterium]MDQ2958254.1 C-terminal binding protein [Actinomycetota bacterium]
MSEAVVYTDPAWLVADGQLCLDGFELVERPVLDGVELRVGPFDSGRFRPAGPALHEAVAGAAVLVIYRCQVTPELLDAAGPGLRAVIRQGVGTDNLNAELLAERGIAAFHIPDYCVDEVATHTTALALALERGLIIQHRTLADGRFDIYAGGTPRRVSVRTLGIVGFGRIGRAVARKLGVQYGRTLVFDPYLGRDLAEGYGAHSVGSLAELLAESDLVTLHCPLTAETDGMIGIEQFRAMKPDSYLVNAARGRLIQPAALATALADDELAGVALDVFVPENPHEDPVWAPVLTDPRVVLTSHRAFLSADAEQSSRRRVAELARDVLAGQPSTIGRLA